MTPLNPYVSYAVYFETQFKRSLPPTLPDLIASMASNEDPRDVLYAEYTASYGKFFIYSITEFSGDLFVPISDGKFRPYRHLEKGRKIIAWAKEASGIKHDCFFKMLDACRDVKCTMTFVTDADYTKMGACRTPIVRIKEW